MLWCEFGTLLKIFSSDWLVVWFNLAKLVYYIPVNETIETIIGCVYFKV